MLEDFKNKFVLIEKPLFSKPDKINIIENDNAKIKVLGVGGGGSNAVSRMFKDKIPKVEYLIFNTDSQALEQSDVSTIVKIGDQTARGLGVGGDPERGRECAEESKSLIRELVDNSDLVFVAAGMGGGENNLLRLEVRLPSAP